MPRCPYSPRVPPFSPCSSQNVVTADSQYHGYGRLKFLFLLWLMTISTSAALARLTSPPSGQKFVPLQVGSNPDSPAPPACVDTYKAIKPLIASYPHPASWTPIIACDDRAIRCDYSGRHGG